MLGDEHNSNGNGKPKEQAAPFPTITIQVTDPANLTLNVQGEFPSLDYALNMLAQATREFEAQWRLMRAAEYQRQQILAAQDAQIREQFRRSH